MLQAVSDREAAARILSDLDAASERVASLAAGRKLVWRIWGRGTPLVMLHGGSGSWRHWTRNIPTLARKYRLLAADLPGFGDSDRPAEPASLQQIGADVAAGIDQIIGADTPYHLLAFSFGGQVAGQFIAQHVRRLISVNLIAPGGMAKAEVPPLVAVRSKTGAAREEAHRANLQSLMIADPARIDALAIEIQEQNSSRARLKLAGLRSARSLLAALETTQFRINAFWGANDQFARGRAAERGAVMQALQTDIDINLVADCGHWAAYERADVLNARLLALLEKRAGQFESQAAGALPS